MPSNEFPDPAIEVLLLTEDPDLRFLPGFSELLDEISALTTERLRGMGYSQEGIQLLLVSAADLAMLEETP